MKDLTVFNVQIGSEVKAYSDTISIARCRIFYKGLNRNGGYITDEFAEKLLSTVAYAPVKGIYEVDDFTDHGKSNEEGRIYGVVPQDYNLEWETVVDDDGVSRTYATVDVYLYTALYEEAKEIFGKSQSMELYPPSIQGKWSFINGRKAFVYDDAAFFGLQALGEEVEPCFEGAAFYNLKDSFKELIDKLEEYNKQEDNLEMNIKDFKLSDDEKFNILFDLVNPNCNEENGWEVNYWICAVYDKYAVARQFDGSYTRIYYTKDDETNTIEIGEYEKCFITDVTESEMLALNAIQELNGGNFEAADEVYKAGKESEEKISEFNQKIVDLEENISTLTVERDTANNSVEEKELSIHSLNETIESLEAANAALETEKATAEQTISALNEFKHATELANKQSIINKYSKQLSEDIITEFTTNIEDYSIDNLEKELAYALVNSQPSLFTEMHGVIPKPQNNKWNFLDKYESKND